MLWNGNQRIDNIVNQFTILYLIISFMDLFITQPLWSNSQITQHVHFTCFKHLLTNVWNREQPWDRKWHISLKRKYINYFLPSLKVLSGKLLLTIKLGYGTVYGTSVRIDNLHGFDFLSIASFTGCLRQSQHGSCRMGNPQRIYPIIIDDWSVWAIPLFLEIDYEITT